jgi:hypothetical protein
LLLAAAGGKALCDVCKRGEAFRRNQLRGRTGALHQQTALRLAGLAGAEID